MSRPTGPPGTRRTDRGSICPALGWWVAALQGLPRGPMGRQRGCSAPQLFARMVVGIKVWQPLAPARYPAFHAESHTELVDVLGACGGWRPRDCATALLGRGMPMASSAANAWAKTRAMGTDRPARSELARPRAGGGLRLSGFPLGARAWECEVAKIRGSRLATIPGCTSDIFSKCWRRTLRRRFAGGPRGSESRVITEDGR